MAATPEAEQREAVEYSICPHCDLMITPGDETRMVPSLLDGYLVAVHATHRR